MFIYCKNCQICRWCIFAYRIYQSVQIFDRVSQHCIRINKVLRWRISLKTNTILYCLGSFSLHNQPLERMQQHYECNFLIFSWNWLSRIDRIWISSSPWEASLPYQWLFYSYELYLGFHETRFERTWPKILKRWRY